jgi:hypothetical protein
MSNPIADKLRAAADKIDPQTDGIAILIVGDVQYGPFGITRTGNDEFDAKRLALAVGEAVARVTIRETPQLHPYWPTRWRDGIEAGI